jgi:hypothetical protein
MDERALSSETRTFLMGAWEPGPMKEEHVEEADLIQDHDPLHHDTDASFYATGLRE